MNRKVTLALVLIGIIAFYGCVTVPSVNASVTVAVLCFLGGLTLGAIVTGWLASFFTTTTWETGVELPDYIYNVGVEWSADYNNTQIMYQNDYNLLNKTLKYYWFRLAEYTAQQYIHNDTFPFDTVLEESSIGSEWLNFTRSRLDSMDNLLNALNSFTVDTLTGFESLDVRAKRANGTVFSVKDLEPLYLTWDENVGSITTSWENFSTQFVYDKATMDALAEPARYLVTELLSSYTTFYIRFQNSTGSTILTIDSGQVGGAGGGKYYTWRFEGLNKTMYDDFVDGETYTISVKSGAPQDEAIFGIPVCFIPIYTESPSHTYRVNLFHNYTGTDKVGRNDYAVEYRFQNDSTVQYTAPFTQPETNLEPLTELLGQYVKNAMSAGQAYWNYLRNLGYSNVSDVPSQYLIPSPSVVWVNDDVTGALTADQLYALYTAYLAGMAEFFNSDDYRDYNVTATDINLADLDYTYNASAYESDNSTIFENTRCIIMPTTDDLNLTICSNSTVAQAVNIVTFEGVKNFTTTYYGLNTGDKIHLIDVYKEGVLQENLTSFEIGIQTIGQIAQKYDFTLEGDPTYAKTTSYAWLLSLMIPLLILTAVMSLLDRGKRRKSK